MAVPWVNLTSFAPNWLRDGSQDWTAAFRAALDALLRMPLTSSPGVINETRTLYVPPGFYPISEPLRISLIQDGAYQPVTLSIVGEATGLQGVMHDSVIAPLFADRPAILIQSAVAVSLKRLVILGLNDWGEQFKRTNLAPEDEELHLREELTAHLPNPVDPYLVKDFEVRTPLGSTFKVTARDVSSSPYAGICIDPFHPQVPPAERYPKMSEAYQASPGLASQGVTIEDCQIYGFVVGLCVSPSGMDFPFAPAPAPITVTQTGIKRTKSCVSVSGPRQVILNSIGIGQTRHCINCVDYAGPLSEQGKPRLPGYCPSIYGANIGGTKYIFLTGNSGGCATLSGIYVESTFSLGQLGMPLAPGEPMDQYSISGCGMALFNPQDRGTEVVMGKSTPKKPLPAIGAHLINHANTHIMGCTFIPSRGGIPDIMDPPIHLINHGSLTLESCRLGGAKSRTLTPPPPPKPDPKIPNPDLGPQFWISGALDRVTFFNTVFTDTLVKRVGDAIILETADITWTQIHRTNNFHAAPYLTAQALPGGLYMTQSLEDAAKEVILTMGEPDPDKSWGPLLRWVNGQYPLIPLKKPGGGDFTLKDFTMMARDGSASFECEPGKVVEGDLLIAAQPWPGVLVRPRRNLNDPAKDALSAGPLLLGRVSSVVLGTVDKVTLSFVPLAFHKDLGGDRPVSLFIAYYPRIHPRTVGRVARDIKVITNVQTRPIDSIGNPVVPIPSSWAKGHRILGQGIRVGTYITAVSSDAIEISLAGAQDIASERIYDADLQGVESDPV